MLSAAVEFHISFHKPSVSVVCAKNSDSIPPEEVSKTAICPYQTNPEVITSEEVFDTKLTCPVEPAGGRASSCWLCVAFEDAVMLDFVTNMVEEEVTKE